MSHNEVYKCLELYLPTYAGENAEAWFPNGKNSIRIRQANGQEFVFTCQSRYEWRFETIKSFLKTVKGDK